MKETAHIFRPFWTLLIIGVIVQFSACVGSGHLTRRYKEVTYNNAWSEADLKKVVQVNGFVFNSEKNPTTARGFFEMSPQGQKELIKVLADKDAKTDGLLATLGSPLKTGAGPLIVDHTTFTKRLVFTIIDLSGHPADRITKANIAVTVPHTISVLSFDKIVTKYESIDLGKLDFSNTTNLGISANAGAGAYVGDTSSAASIPAMGGAGYGVNANASNTRQFSEAVTLNQRYIALTGYVTPTSLNLYEESVSGIDLTGNIVAEATFQFTGNSITDRATYSFSDLYQKDAANEPDKIKVTEQYQRYPSIDSDIAVGFTYSATVRKVTKGDRTVSESDDEIELASGTTATAQSMILVDKKELTPKFWIIKANDRVLQIKGPLANAYGTLFFASIDDAQGFLGWLRKKGEEVLRAGGKVADKQYGLQLDDHTAVSSVFVANAVVGLASK